MADSVFDRLCTESVVAWYNRLLAREDWARAALAPYAGRTARIDAGLASVLLAVTPGGTLAVGGRSPGVTPDATPSVTITLEPRNILGSLFNPAAAPDKMRENLHMEGDAVFAQTLIDVLSKLRPDPAEDLARLVGDAPAERIVGAVNAAIAQLRETAERVARHGADYLVAENPMLLGKQEFEQFGKDVAALQTRLELLEQRIDAVRPRSAAPSVSPSAPGGGPTPDPRA